MKKSDNKKGNPYHDEEGKFTSAEEQNVESFEDWEKMSDLEIKIKQGVDISSILSSEQKKEGVEPTSQEIVEDYSKDIINYNLKSTRLASGIKVSMESGTKEAQILASNFFKLTKINIENGSAAYRWTFYNPFIGSSFSKITFRGTDLTGVGKLGIPQNPGETFYHECFHGIDMEYYDNIYRKKCISCDYKIDGDLTFQEIFQKEIADNKYSMDMRLFYDIKKQFDEEAEAISMREYGVSYKDFVEKMDIIKKQLTDNARALKEGKITPIQYNNLYKSLLQDFKEESKKEFRVKCIAAKKFSILSDFCSFIYKTGVGENSICGGHSRKYWNEEGGKKPAKEMFAEMGSMWSRNDIEQINLIKKYFPNTYNAFLKVVGKLDAIRSERWNKN